jgi:hypothetical protein
MTEYRDLWQQPLPQRQNHPFAKLNHALPVSAVILGLLAYALNKQSMPLSPLDVSAAASDIGQDTHDSVRQLIEQNDTAQEAGFALAVGQ